jgi:hypothetical protein
MLLVISDAAIWGSEKVEQQEARVDVCYFDLPEKVRKEEEEAGDEEERTPAALCLKGLRVKFLKDEPRIPGTETVQGDVFSLVMEAYQGSWFKEEYDKRYARDCGEEVNAAGEIGAC